MGQRSGTGGSARPARPRRADPLARVGDYVIVSSLRRDDLGEVCAATGPGGDVRIRLVTVRAHDRFDEVAARLETVRHPAVATTVERLELGEETALVGAADALTLADRRRRGAIGPAAAVATGAALLDGLAALHEADVVHGAVDAALVGIDPAGHPRWRDAGLWSARRVAHDGEEPRPEADVEAFARMARSIGGLPTALAAAVDRIAAGEVPAPSARALARAWRELGAAAGLAVPPPGSAVRAAALLPPPPRRRRRVPRWLRAGSAAAAALAAVAVVPTARAVPGGGSPFDDISAYVPSRAGAHLRYSFQQSTAVGGSTSGNIGLNVATAAAVAGVQTVELVPDSGTAAPGGSGAQYPFGLGGATLRVQGGAVVRAAQGGTVRDVVGPLRPGLRWSDTRAGLVSTVTTLETRVLLGPAAVTEPAGRFERCVVVALASVEQGAGPGGSQAAGYAWYCPGVGLVRALLTSSSGETDVIDLVAMS